MQRVLKPSALVEESKEGFLQKRCNSSNNVD